MLSVCLSVCSHLPQFVPSPFVFSLVLLLTNRAHNFFILLTAFCFLLVLSFPPHTYARTPHFVSSSIVRCFISLIVVAVGLLWLLLLLLRLVSPVFSKLSLFEAFVFADQVPDPASEYIDQELCM